MVTYLMWNLKVVFFYVYHRRPVGGLDCVQLRSTVRQELLVFHHHQMEGQQACQFHAYSYTEGQAIVDAQRHVTARLVPISPASSASRAPRAKMQEGDTTYHLESNAPNEPAEFRSYKIEFTAGPFKHNAAVALLLGPCMFPLLALSGVCACVAWCELLL